MEWNLSAWPLWGIRVAWSALTIGIAFVAGHLVRAFLAARLVRFAKKTPADWDDVLIVELKRRIPFWAVLIGIWLALGHWDLPSRWQTLATSALSTLGILSVTLLAAAVATRAVMTYGPLVTPSVPVSGLTQNVVRIVIFTIGLLIILNGFDVDIRPLLATLGVGGLAIALALQEPLSNLFAGLFVTLTGQIRLGDYIRLDSGVEGYVRDFNWRSARLQSLAGKVVVVPNSKLSQAVVTNLSMPGPDVAVAVEATVAYASDLAKVERVALDVAREVAHAAAGAEAGVEPSVRFHTFGDLGVRLSVSLRVRTFPDQFLIRHELIKRLHARFEQEGIQATPAAVPRPTSPPQT